MVHINYFAVLACAILSMVIGAIWYGPLFGRIWSKMSGVDPDDLEAIKKLQKAARPMYLIQFILTLFQVFVFAWYAASIPSISVFSNAMLIWGAFIIPIVAGNAMWNNDSKDTAFARFFIQAGYQLILFVVFALVITFWK